MKKIDQQDHVTSTDVITLCKAGAQLGGGGGGGGGVSSLVLPCDPLKCSERKGIQ